MKVLKEMKKRTLQSLRYLHGNFFLSTSWDPVEAKLFDKNRYLCNVLVIGQLSNKGLSIKRAEYTREETDDEEPCRETDKWMYVQL